LRSRRFTRTGFISGPRRVRFWRVRVRVGLAMPAVVPVTNLTGVEKQVAS
jgi:uncharacterized protein YllA (UPF0747 family)